MIPEIDIKELIRIAKAAGSEIMSVYDGDVSIEYKDDKSPLTEADKKSHELIKRELSGLYPEIPLLSEEGKDIEYSERKNWKFYWLVDPLDGTKEFIKRNGEFTVNIALMEVNRPVAGVVYAPAKGLLYFAEKGKGSFVQKGSNVPKKLKPEPPADTGLIRVVGSRSHSSKEVQVFIQNLAKDYQTVEMVPVGSSLKICLVAEGQADLYPRLRPTMEWDVAAAHAVASEAGRRVCQYHSGEELVYNKESLLNDWFIVK
jgi:3'(2'), 5'-bisphosphate nucleotidase